ncbi:hypothetical protein BKA70DRAFT_1315888 [Coprinopsis sp. MPI-PUGE-AT-0042]|nr:hypothetical protein BKA70DRAFT_1316461 [Coprinopsis sp. MPI-PUGE-AT-0042]KAH6897818.1 hypothetical protein BKA70DRAFT_1315888 [Coprinopsis sp. MPI-PUGE-AT-0042]
MSMETELGWWMLTVVIVASVSGAASARSLPIFKGSTTESRGLCCPKRQIENFPTRRGSPKSKIRVVSRRGEELKWA